MDLLSIFLQNTYSLASLKHRLRILKLKLSHDFYGGEVSESFSPQDLAWINSLPQPFLEKFTKDNLSEIFADMEEKINKLQTLVIFLPFETNDEVIQLIGAKARSTFTNQLLLDIKFDPNLIAGCAFSFRGIYKDYSLRARIEDKKETILASFKQFLR